MNSQWYFSPEISSFGAADSDPEPSSQKTWKCTQHWAKQIFIFAFKCTNLVNKVWENIKTPQGHLNNLQSDMSSASSDCSLISATKHPTLGHFIFLPLFYHVEHKQAQNWQHKNLTLNFSFYPWNSSSKYLKGWTKQTLVRSENFRSSGFSASLQVMQQQQQPPVSLQPFPFTSGAAECTQSVSLDMMTPTDRGSKRP